MLYLRRGGGEIGDRRGTKLDGRNGTENLLGAEKEEEEEEFFDALHKAYTSLDLPATEAAIFLSFLLSLESNRTLKPLQNPPPDVPAEMKWSCWNRLGRPR
jgi:hypothetical protein